MAADDMPGPVPNRSRTPPVALCHATAALVCLVAASCQPAQPPPSIVLAVIDTTRSGAVSAYGRVSGTTPVLDALASDGLLYEHAFANSNWTLPSHATLFTGRLPMRHGVHGRSDKLDLPTIAERLRDAGYDTVGFSENPWLSAAQNMQRGFDEFTMHPKDIAQAVADWLAARRSHRPFFLFVNIMDAHTPYLVRETNPYLPSGVTPAEATAVAADLVRYRCNSAPQDRGMQILRGLYLGNVHAADAKLGAVLDALAAARPAPVVIATSDHGEHFGEHGRMEHELGADRAVTQVPLIVHGFPGVAPARIAAPVQLADIMPTVLAWAGLAVPPELPGRPLPTRVGQTDNDRVLISEFYNEWNEEVRAELPPKLKAMAEKLVEQCDVNHRIDGDMRAAIHYPYEWLWYERYPSQLFDLSADRDEQNDLSAAMPERVAALAGALQQRLATTRRDSPPQVQLDAAQTERLRALGYLGGRSGATTQP